MKDIFYPFKKFFIQIYKKPDRKGQISPKHEQKIQKRIQRRRGIGAQKPKVQKPAQKGKKQHEKPKLSPAGDHSEQENGKTHHSPEDHVQQKRHQAVFHPVAYDL